MRRERKKRLADNKRQLHNKPLVPIYFYIDSAMTTVAVAPTPLPLLVSNVPGPEPASKFQLHSSVTAASPPELQ